MEKLLKVEKEEFKSSIIRWPFFGFKVLFVAQGKQC
tara:strand:- start:613 stop:720 length:108 start_codon:yes stop_codon:yes gene_type:complete